jgi:predicted DNA-binding protein YlxM (UPF0122 family)
MAANLADHLGLGDGGDNAQRSLYSDKTNSIPEICRMLNISRATLYRYVKATHATT